MCDTLKINQPRCVSQEMQIRGIHRAYLQMKSGCCSSQRRARRVPVGVSFQDWKIRGGQRADLQMTSDWPWQTSMQGPCGCISSRMEDEGLRERTCKWSQMAAAAIDKRAGPQKAPGPELHAVADEATQGCQSCACCNYDYWAPPSHWQPEAGHLQQQS